MAPLKLEARRRLAAGDFGTLHAAQLAIAREYFTDRFLGLEAARKLMTDLSRIAARLREELVVTQDDPLVAARSGGIGFEAEAEVEPPHRLRGFWAYPVGSRVIDAWVAAPHIQLRNRPCSGSRGRREGFAELGLAGVVLAGGAPGRPGWLIARGWADLDQPEPLRPGHRFPAYGVTRLITATAVLRLSAGGRVRLDDPASDHLRTVPLADSAVTIRKLLSYSGGVDNPRS